LILVACTRELYAGIAGFRVQIFDSNAANVDSEQKWLTRFNEFTGAVWPALLNDISRFCYTPVIGRVNR